MLIFNLINWKEASVPMPAHNWGAYVKPQRTRVNLNSIWPNPLYHLMEARQVLARPYFMTAWFNFDGAARLLHAVPAAYFMPSALVQKVSISFIHHNKYKYIPDLYMYLIYICTWSIYVPDLYMYLIYICTWSIWCL